MGTEEILLTVSSTSSVSWMHRKRITSARLRKALLWTATAAAVVSCSADAFVPTQKFSTPRTTRKPLSRRKEHGVFFHDVHASLFHGRCDIQLKFTACEEDVDIRKASSSSRKVISEETNNSDKSVHTQLPPWLKRYSSFTSQEVEHEIGWLEYALIQKGFSGEDIREIVNTLLAVGQGDDILTIGMVDFLRLTLTLFEEDNCLSDSGSVVSAFVTTPVLLASILHYADCVAARRQGVPEMILQTLRRRNQRSSGKGALPALPASKESSTSAPVEENHPSIAVEVPDSATRGSKIHVMVNDEIDILQPVSTMDIPQATSASTPSSKRTSAESLPSASPSAQAPPEILDNEEVMSIAQGASRIKRAELLAQAVLSTSATHGSAANPVLSPDTAERVGSLLLSLMDDWRSLAIRVVACLYRLEGFLQYQQLQQKAKCPTLVPTPAMLEDEEVQNPWKIVQTASEAMHIYATLAERLGMHRLKAKIEERAFRILYKRQYGAVSAMYRQEGETLQSMSRHLLAHISHTLRNDDALMGNLEDLQVQSRVKEPYSIWKKLLKTRAKGLAPATRRSRSTSKVLASSSKTTDNDARKSRDLSMAQINDVVALRVILKARKLHPEESEETTRERERLLCYYAQHLILAGWPETNPGRVKDYIADPKPNGYQSLHHTSQIDVKGVDYPFEVQVRSEEMHKLAEFGYAAHWDYKLGSTPVLETKTGLANQTTLSKPLHLLPAASSSSSSSMTSTIDVKDYDPSSNMAAWNQEALLSALSKFSQKPSRLVLPSSKPSGSYVEALLNAKKDILNRQVHVFVVEGGSAPGGKQQGEILIVPINSSIRDATAEVQNVADARVQVWRNGRLATMDETLENGDVMTIAL